MKIKEKYERILYALKENEINDEWSKINFNKKKFLNFLKEYPYWAVIEDYHCCEGWRERCWSDIYESGVWGFSNKDTIKYILSILDNKVYKKHLKKFPISCQMLPFNLKNKCITIFVTLRDVEKNCCVDYFFSGFKDKR